MALPYLYLKGLSSGDFSDVMSVLLGKEAIGFSADTVLPLRKEWKEDYKKWSPRHLESKNYVYLWADGVYLQARMELEKQCMLVIIGATPEGKKELIGFLDGYRENAQSWKELLLDLKARGFSVHRLDFLFLASRQAAFQLLPVFNLFLIFFSMQIEFFL